MIFLFGERGNAYFSLLPLLSKDGLLMPLFILEYNRSR